LLARSLNALGVERAWVVHGAGGLDELSTLGHSKVSELHAGTVNTFYVHPADAGLPLTQKSTLLGGDAPANAEIVRRLLDGEAGPRRDIVLFNAAAALLIAGRAATLRDGVQMAADSLASGRARAALERLCEVCRR
jgi:anthranilate phosphoribosyltransferase